MKGISATVVIAKCHSMEQGILIQINGVILQEVPPSPGNTKITQLVNSCN